MNTTKHPTKAQRRTATYNATQAFLADAAREGIAAANRGPSPSDSGGVYTAVWLAYLGDREVVCDECRCKAPATEMVPGGRNDGPRCRDRMACGVRQAFGCVVATVTGEVVQ